MRSYTKYFGLISTIFYRMEEQNFYEILGVSSTASYSEIKKKYQQLVRQYHPDKQVHVQQSEHSKEEMLANYLAIDKAWEVLSDFEKRQQYDNGLRDCTLSQEWPVSAEVDLDDMKYQEDYASYSWPCRCSGEYHITEDDLENGRDVVCCSQCTLSIRVSYTVVNGDDDNTDDT